MRETEPTEHDEVTQRLESRAFERYKSDEGARHYADKFERNSQRRRTQKREALILREYLSRFANDASLMNVPCGAGRFSDLIQASQRREVIYADSSVEMLKEAGDHLSQLGEIDVRLKQVDLLEEEPVDSVDIVLCIRLLHHFATDARISRAVRYLCSCAQQGVIFTFASNRTVKGCSRQFRSAVGLRQGGERILNQPQIEAELLLNGFVLEAVSYVDRLFSSQTWILAKRI